MQSYNAPKINTRISESLTNTNLKFNKNIKEILNGGYEQLYENNWNIF